MALMPISNSNVECHLTSRSADIVNDMSDFLKYEIIISPQDILYVSHDSLGNKNGNHAMARFEYTSNTIKIDCYRIALKCQNLLNNERFSGMQKNDVLLFPELILEHELAHVYQKQYLNKNMKLDDVYLEEEADNIAIEYFSSYNDMNDEQIKK